MHINIAMYIRLNIATINEYDNDIRYTVRTL